MKKLLKILAVAAIAVAAAMACIFVGCKKSGGESTSDYNFVIYMPDGTTPVNGNTDGSWEDGTKVWTSVCLPQSAGGTCVDLPYQNVYPDANGKISFSQSQINTYFNSDTDVTEFSFHVYDVTGCAHNCEKEVSGKGDYKIILSAAQ